MNGKFSFDNLILAGRLISGTHIAQSSSREMPIYANIGMAAGFAAAMSVKKGILPRNIDVKGLQSLLKKAGMEAPERKWNHDKKGEDYE